MPEFLTATLSLVVLVSSVWVLVDSHKNRIQTHGFAYTVNTGCLAWFLGCLFLWIVVFPVYLVRRRKILSLRREQAAMDALFRRAKLAGGIGKGRARRSRG